MKKGLLIGTLISLGSCAVMLILSIFGISFFEGVKGDILISFATLTAGGIFAISSVNLIKYNKKIAYISLGAICLAVLLIIISTFAEIGGVFSDITFTVATLSILFNVIVSGNLKLQKRLLALQIVAYVIVGLLCLYLILMIFGILSFVKTWQIMLVLIILTVAMLITLAVVSNKAPNVEQPTKDYVKIPRAEYEELLVKAKKYDELNVK